MLISFTINSEKDYMLFEELRAILRTNRGKESNDCLCFDPAVVYLTEIPCVISAVEKVINAIQQLPGGNGDVSVEISNAEASALKQLMYSLLMEFNTTAYKNRKFTNPFTAIAFGKLYNAVSEEEHPHLQKEHFNTVALEHIEGIQRLGYSKEEIATFEALLK